jgi:hypothetical protein
VPKLKWLKWLFIMLPLTISMGPCQFMSSCSTTPDPIVPPETKSYTYEILYERPSIMNPEGSDPGEVNLEIHAKDGSMRGFSPRLTKLNDYAFTATSVAVYAGNLVKVYLVDPKRWEERTPGPGLIWGNPHSVGDIFTLKCIETGFEKKLLKIEDCPFSGLPGGFKAYRASCKIQPDGTITDE